MELNKKGLEEILELLKDTDIGEIEIKEGNTRIKIVRKCAYQNIPVEKRHVTAEKEDSTVEVPKEDDKGVYTLKSYMTGVFYRSNVQDGEPLVKEGDKVDLDQPLCVIECMKNLNEIKLIHYSKEFKAGRGIVHKILVENGSDVEPGKPLFLIKPGG